MRCQRYWLVWSLEWYVKCQLWLNWHCGEFPWKSTAKNIRLKNEYPRLKRFTIRPTGSSDCGDRYLLSCSFASSDGCRCLLFVILDNRVPCCIQRGGGLWLWLWVWQSRSSSIEMNRGLVSLELYSRDPEWMYENPVEFYRKIRVSTERRYGIRVRFPGNPSVPTGTVFLLVWPEGAEHPGPH
jgi:hypothetical protein